MNKFFLLQRLQYERDKFELLLNRVGFARQLTMKGVLGNHSTKDLLADVLSRGQFIADRLSEALHGETYCPCTSYTALEAFQQRYGYPDYESPLTEQEIPNRWVVERFKNIALEEIVAQELAAYANIVDAIRQLTHYQFLDHDLYRRVAVHTYKPYRRVEAEIERWQKRIGAGPI